ncbi:MAG: hypothetical protein HYZ53_15155 [Planctomycetes bacterium]|nr:hypothetical protein [Planctomycetota bacterium]
MIGRLAVAAAVLALALGAARVLQGDGEGALAPGKAAPELKAEGWLNGDAPAPDALKGKVRVLDFFAFW